MPSRFYLRCKNRLQILISSFHHNSKRSLSIWKNQQANIDSVLIVATFWVWARKFAVQWPLKQMPNTNLQHSVQRNRHQYLISHLYYANRKSNSNWWKKLVTNYWLNCLRKYIKHETRPTMFIICITI